MPRRHRLTVIGCMLSWFLLGLHFPALHQMTHHGQAPSWTVLSTLVLLSVVAVTGLWLLLRPGTARS